MDANGRNGQVHSGVSWSDGMEKTSIPGSIPGVLVVGHKAIVFFFRIVFAQDGNI